MCEALRELMKDQIEQDVARGEARGEARGIIDTCCDLGLPGIPKDFWKADGIS